MRCVSSLLTDQLADAHVDSPFRSALWPSRSDDRDAAARFYPHDQSRSRGDLGRFNATGTPARIPVSAQISRSIPSPQIVVPGNHDVPLHNLFSRFLASLDRYRYFISDDLEPFYHDSEIAVLGMNTARSLAWKGGRINRQQLEKLRARFREVPNSRVKIVVTHHPFDLPKRVNGNHAVGGAQRAMQTIAECRVDLLLAGHFHVSATGYTATRYEIKSYASLIVSCGTSTSTRGRGQPNSLNVIQIDDGNITIARQTWRPERCVFDHLSTERFSRTEKGWMQA